VFDQDYLNLRLVRLNASNPWEIQGNGFLFVFPSQGVGLYDSGVETIQFKPSDVLIVNATKGGKVSAANGREVVFSCFSLCFEHLFPLLFGNEVSLLRTVTDGFRVAKLYPAGGTLAVECYRLLEGIPPQFSLEHRSQLVRIAAVVLSAEFNGVRRQQGGFARTEEHVAQVFESLSAAEILALPVDQLAAKFNCSRRHLNRLFHQHFGFSVAALKMEMRLLKAMSLLQDPDAKVITVASECGFNHLGLFNTCFKRRFGASPGRWRKTPIPVNSDTPVNPVILEGSPNCTLRSHGLCPWCTKGNPDQRLQPDTDSILMTKLSNGRPSPQGHELTVGIRPKIASKSYYD
jgi:AraC-like DNA-binding protein